MINPAAALLDDHDVLTPPAQLDRRREACRASAHD
jgi:hypothetical protein